VQFIQDQSSPEVAATSKCVPAGFRRNGARKCRSDFVVAPDRFRHCAGPRS